MCQNRNLLARNSAGRSVAQCEHGILHLSWDIATLHLRADDFLTLDGFLYQCGRHDGAPLSEGWCALERGENSVARVWIGPVGLVFSAAELPQFAALVRQAARALHKADEQRGLPIRPLDCPVLVIDGATVGLN